MRTGAGGGRLAQFGGFGAWGWAGGWYSRGAQGLALPRHTRGGGGVCATEAHGGGGGSRGARPA